jgi:hypothetical protein
MQMLETGRKTGQSMFSEAQPRAIRNPACSSMEFSSATLE